MRPLVSRISTFSPRWAASRKLNENPGATTAPGIPKEDKVKSADIAKIVNVAIQATRLDDENPAIIAWDDLSEETRGRYETGVNFHLANPEATAADGHKNWLERTVGVPDKTREEFDSLSAKEKMERVLFLSIVKECSKVQPEIKVVKIAAPAPQLVQASKLPVKYIGHRAQYRDGIYGTGIIWKQGEVILVDEPSARKMLKHADVWTLAAQEEQAKEAPEKPKEKEDETEESVQAAKDSVARMGKAAMLQYAETNFAGVKINQNIGIEKLREKVYGLIDRFGVAK